MGFTDRIGTPLVLSHGFTMEELFERIQDVPFEAGHPRLGHAGNTSVIFWPQMDRCNQIQIIYRKGSFRCVRSCLPLDPRGIRPEGFFPRLWLYFLSHFGRSGEECRALADQTGKQINGLRL